MYVSLCVSYLCMTNMYLQWRYVSFPAPTLMTVTVPKQKAFSFSAFFRVLDPPALQTYCQIS